LNLPSEQKNSSVSLNFFKWGFLLYIAILPIAGTIALRNILLAALVLVSSVWFFNFKLRSVQPGGQRIIFPRTYWLFGIFLLIFPLISKDFDTAVSSLRSQWGPGMLAWFVGIIAGHLLPIERLKSRTFIIASGFLVIIHLLEITMAWSGLLGSHVTIDMSWSEMWNGFKSVFINGYQWPPIGGIPWKFRGFDDMHGNVGNTGLQAIALITIFHFRNQAAPSLPRYLIAISLIFISFFVSGSRGSVIFGFLLIMIALYLLNRGRSIVSIESIGRNWSYALIGGLVAMILFSVSLSHDSRWDISAVVKKLETAAAIQDPLNFICEGKDQVAQTADHQEPVGSHDITNESIGGDGARVLLMRAGLSLVIHHPWGLDGSRQSYQKLISMHCSHLPQVEYAHTHQGWMNMALALGWLGAGLYALIFLEIIYKSAKKSTSSKTNQDAAILALLLLSIFWVMRGFLDSVYQDHFLQMQGVMIGFLYARSKFNRPNLV